MKTQKELIEEEIKKIRNGLLTSFIYVPIGFFVIFSMMNTIVNGLQNIMLGMGSLIILCWFVVILLGLFKIKDLREQLSNIKLKGVD